MTALAEWRKFTVAIQASYQLTAGAVGCPSVTLSRLEGLAARQRRMRTRLAACATPREEGSLGSPEDDRDAPPARPRQHRYVTRFR
jgi:hypothetical protein